MTRPVTVLWFLLAAGMPLTAEAEPIHVNVDNYVRAESDRQLDWTFWWRPRACYRASMRSASAFGGSRG